MPTSSASVYHLAAYSRPKVGAAAAGTSFTFELVAPPKEPDWSVMWAFEETGRARTRWETLRARCASILDGYGMIALARRVSIAPALHFIPSSEIKE